VHTFSVTRLLKIIEIGSCTYVNSIGRQISDNFTTPCRPIMHSVPQRGVMRVNCCIVSSFRHQ